MTRFREVLGRVDLEGGFPDWFRHRGQRADAGWIKTGRGCIDHELSHGNTHAIGAPVPNTEDGFRVRDDNKVNVTAFRGISDCRFHLFWMDNGKIGRVLRRYKNSLYPRMLSAMPGS